MGEAAYKASDFEGRGVYSDQAIIHAIRLGHIVCSPLIPENVKGSSIDITLGENFYTITDKRHLPPVYDPYDEAHIRRKFNGPHLAKPHRQIVEELGIEPFRNIPLATPVIVVHPRERILAHTEEFIGIKPPGTSEMHARSSIGRHGAVVAHDAGWGDPGYVNRWTMEIQNIDEHQAIVLAVGERVAQMVFYYTPEVEHEYSDKPGSGNYQSFSADALDEMQSTWVPAMMLPKALTVPTPE